MASEQEQAEKVAARLQNRNHVTRSEGKQCVGAGWHGLVDRCYDLLDASGLDYTVEQVKEKFGGLRFYWTFWDREVASQLFLDARQAIYDIEAQSLKVCEICGQPGRKAGDGFRVDTLCPEHARERGHTFGDNDAED